MRLLSGAINIFCALNIFRRDVCFIRCFIPNEKKKKYVIDNILSETIRRFWSCILLSNIYRKINLMTKMCLTYAINIVKNVFIHLFIYLSSRKHAYIILTPLNPTFI